MNADLVQLWIYLLYIYTLFILMKKGHMLRMLEVYESSGSGLKNHTHLLYLCKVPCQEATNSQTIYSHNSRAYRRGRSLPCKYKWLTYHIIGIIIANYFSTPELYSSLTNTARDNMGHWVQSCIIWCKRVVVAKAGRVHKDIPSIPCTTKHKSSHCSWLKTFHYKKPKTYRTDHVQWQENLRLPPMGWTLAMARKMLALTLIWPIFMLP